MKGSPSSYISSDVLLIFFLIFFYFLANVLERAFQLLYKPVFLHKKLWRFSLLLSSPIHFAHQWIEPWFTHYGELLHPKQIYSFGTLFGKYLSVGEIKGELKAKLTRDSTTIHRRNNQISCYFKQCKRIGRDYFRTQIFIEARK